MRTLIIIVVLCCTGNAAERKLILHADDFGMSHAVNRATIELLDSGRVSSASIMMPCPWVPEAAAYARKHPEKDIGLHLTLTSEWNALRWGPVAAVDRVPGLLDEEGYLWRNEGDVARHASPSEVELELRAQITKAKKLGIRFTHFDTHMGTLYTRPDFFQVFEKLGREFGVPILRVKPGDREAQYGVPKNVIDYLLSNEARYQAEGVFRLDRLVRDGGGKAKTVEQRMAAYHAVLQALPDGVSMIIVHLGRLDPELAAATASAPQREGDYVVCKDPSTVALLEKLGIQLVGWKDVASSQ
ncbi:MAG: polysaccharide deacetylase family protein [Bryobacteraceae bacterium]